jgi:hypothetical protein
MKLRNTMSKVMLVKVIALYDDNGDVTYFTQEGVEIGKFNGVVKLPSVSHGDDLSGNMYTGGVVTALSPKDVLSAKEKKIESQVNSIMNRKR